MKRRIFLTLTGLGAAALSTRHLFAEATTAPVSSASFLHPGLLHTREELQFIRKKIEASEPPWQSQWEKLQSSKSAALDYQPQAREEVVRGPYNIPNIGSSDFTNDSQAAYTHALQWHLTGNIEHAKIAISILNVWSNTLKTISGHDTLLLIGMVGVRFCNAAELIRHSSAEWPVPEQEQFANMLKNLFYPPIKDFFPFANGNWDASMIQTMIAMGIYLDDRAMFDRAVNYYLHGEGNGSVKNYFNDFGQCQESGRDQGHTQMGIGFLGCACEMAWKQGVDLYSAYDNRLALGFEYTAKYNLGLDVPYQTFGSVNGKYNYKAISNDGRGKFSPIDDRAVYHYHYRKGIDMPYCRQATEAKVHTEHRRHDRDKRDGNGGHHGHIPWGSLMFAKLPNAPVTSPKKNPRHLLSK